MFDLAGYEKNKLIHKGIHSMVYRGVRKVDNKPVVLKFLNRKDQEEATLARFRREYVMTNSFEYNGIIDVYGLESNDYTLCMIVEDFGGESLDLIMPAMALTLNTFLELAISLVDSLSVIHASHMIHKDINPHNIVWNVETKEVKIIDFGISTELTRENLEVRNPNVLEGTLAYMSPEQTGRMNRSLDYRTDFYSLGATFYELVTGSKPFQVDDPMGMVHSHIALEPQLPSKLSQLKDITEKSRSIVKVLSKMIMKLMAKGAEDRYQSTFGLKKDLSWCLDQLKENITVNDNDFELGKHDVSERFQIPQKLYGRNNEIEAMVESFNRIRQGSKELLLVAGYSGVGKSALVKEIHKPVVDSRGYYVQGKYDQFKRDIPYSAFLRAMSELVKHILCEPENNIHLWRQRVMEHLGSNGQIVLELIPEMALLIGEQPPLAKLGLDETRNRFVSTIQNFIRSLGNKDNPVVIFLDDLQWSDSASLKLIELTMTDKHVQGLMVIGAYRDNEVDSSHPLMDTINRIKKERKRLNDAGVEFEGELLKTIALKPLKREYVLQLTSETMFRPLNEMNEFADLCYQKTEGNPFFLNQLLNTLYEAKIIDLNYELGRWEWDTNQLAQYHVATNVVDLMVKKITDLPEKTQHILKLAACAGNRFDLKTLSIIYNKSLKETADDLWESLREGLIEPQDDAYKYIGLENEKHNAYFAFIHDRIQQAAYSLIEDEQKQILHLSIARLMLNEIVSNNADVNVSITSHSLDQDDSLFDMVNHFNLSKDLLTDSKEQSVVCRLNQIAGKKALRSNAYQSAVNFFETGLALHDEANWQVSFDESMDLYINAMEATYFALDFKRMLALSEIAIKRARTPLEEVPIYDTRMRALSTQEKLIDVLETGSEILKKLGVRLPSNPNKGHIILEFMKTKQGLKGKTIEDLYNMPMMIDLHKIAISRILTGMISSAYFARPDLSPIISMKLVQLSVKHGNYTNPQIYPFYGLMNLVISNDIESCYSFGELGVRLSQKEGFGESRAQTLLMFYTFNQHWKKPLHDSIGLLYNGYSIGIENGDYEYACWCLHCPSYQALYCGHDLNQLSEDMDSYRERMIQLKQETVLNIFTLTQQMTDNLTGKSENPQLLTGKYIQEKDVLKYKDDSSAKTTVASFYAWKFILDYMFYDHTTSEKHIGEYEKYADAMVGLSCVVVIDFYKSLNRLALCENAMAKEKRNHLKKVRSAQKKIKKWAEHAPENHLHKWQLVEAELKRVEGNTSEAIDLFEKAIQGAKDNDYLWELALGQELYGKLWLEQGNIELGHRYLQLAHDVYDYWGAYAKIGQMEAVYPFLVVEESEEDITDSELSFDESLSLDTTDSITSTGTTASSRLDFISSLKTFQAISGEIRLETLVADIMKYVIENAGAEKGLLLLKDDNEWVVRTSNVADRNEWNHSEDKFVTDEAEGLQFLGDNNNFSFSKVIVKLVIRTKEALVVDDASNNRLYGNDDYINKIQPKSILCMPLINQGKLNGILYLENNLITGAFTPDRIQILNMLSTQAAISIENAKLYEELTRSENKFRSIFENAGVGIFQSTLEGKVLTANPTVATILKYDSPEELINNMTSLSDQLYVDPNDRSLFFDKIKECEYVKNFEFKAYCKDHSIIDLSMNVHAQKDDRGNVLYFEGIVEDVTEKKRAEEYKIGKEVAEAATKAKSDFLANISHEIRTPMNAVIGLSDLALRTQLTPKQSDYLRKINNSAKGLLGIINDILDYSKIEAGKMVLEEIPFNLSDIMDSVSTVIGYKSFEKGLELLFNSQGNMPKKLMGDPLRLGQILINLASNAVKFTDHGEILIETTVISQQSDRIKLRFSVKDSGIGMTKEHVSGLFQSFHQVDKSISRRYGGTGLGLAITKQLVDLMNGDIRVESEIDKGTTFYFEVDFGIVEIAEVDNQYLPESIRGIDLLVVDDNTTARNILKEMLESFNFNVDIAASGIEALTAIELKEKEQKNYDAVLLDWKMPHMDGIETVKHVNRIHGASNTPSILMVTAYGIEEVMAASAGLAIDGYLTKPVNPSLLYNSVLEALGHTEFVTEPSRLTTPFDFKDHEMRRGSKVLLVEDNPINQQVATEFLELAGLEVEVANNGRKAIESVERNGYDLVFMDIQLPEIDGLEATRIIRENGHVDLPIIAMTAHALDEDVKRSLQAGMNDHLTKPIDQLALKKILLSWLPEDKPRISVKKQIINEPTGLLIPSYDGFNSTIGVKHVGGSVERYHSLLKEFVSLNDGKVDLIGTHIQSSQLRIAAQEVHSIRGAVALLGGLLLADTSQKLETALSDEQISDIELTFNAFKMQLQLLCKHINSHFEESDKGLIMEIPEMNLMNFSKNLINLQELIEKGSSKAESLATELKSVSLEFGLYNEFEDILSAIEDVEFEKAQIMVNYIIKIIEVGDHKDV